MAILTTTTNGLNFIGGTTYIQTGTTTLMSIAVDGSIAFNEYGAGYLKTDASGNITADNTGGGLPGGPYVTIGTNQTITGIKSFSSKIGADGGIDGLTLANGGITGSNYNITGVNQLVISDPGEGIVFTGTATMYLNAVDDATDSILKLTNATQLNLNSTARITSLVNPTGAQDAATKNYVDTEIGNIPSGLAFEGNWNASTDTPTLAGTTQDNGKFWIVSVAGSTNLSGITDWAVGDWAIYVDNGAGTDAWQKVDNSSTLSGLGAAGKVAFWSTTSNVSFNNNFSYDGTYLTSPRIRVGDGTDGFFYSDSAGRTAFTGGDFYIQSGVTNYFNYATNIYLGDNTGDNVLFRGSTITGTNWGITPAGAATFAGNVISSGDVTADQFFSNNNGNGQNYRIGDDVYIGDINVANTFRVQGSQNPANGYITFGNSSNTQLGRAGTGALTWGGNFEVAGDLTVSGGDIILGGLGRIQGVDTVSAGTDAANKAYVDLEIATRTPLNDIRSLGVRAFTNGANPNITTAQVMDEIDTDGGFDSYSSVFKTSWSYAGNYNLTDAGDFTETAGSSWITWTDNSSDSTRGNITTLAIAPNTGGSAGGVFIYNNQGGSYSPGWRQVWTSMTDGAGSGLDADLLDGQQGSYYLDYANFTGTPTIPSVGNGQIDGRTSGLGLSGSMDATANQSGNTTFTVTSNAVTAATASTIAYRTTSGDLNVRLLRANYQDQTTISGAMAFRVNNGADNYTRYCSSSSAIRTFLGVPASGDLNSYLLNTTDTFVGSLVINGDIRGDGQELVLNAGESGSYATGQTSEHVYVNAEAGLIISSSPDNWSSGWAGRNNTYINRADGTSSFTGKISVQGSNVIEIDQGTSSFNHLHVLSTFGSKLFSATNYGYVLESSSTAANPVTFRFDNDRYRIYSGSSGEALTVLANKKVGINNTAPSYQLDVSGNARATGGLVTSSTQTRNKISVWNSLSNYTIGMKNGFGYGGLGGDGTSTEYAMSFQMSNTTNRGWWWGDTSHSDVQGSMSLTTDGELVVAKSLSIGAGETTRTAASVPLEVTGNALIDGVLTIEGPAPVATQPMLKLTRTSPVVDYQDLGTYYLLTERFKNSGGTVIGSREVWQNPGGSGLYYNFDNGSTGGSQHRQKQNSFHWTINSNSEKLTIGTNGYLGVNDTSPSYQLDVNGSGRFTSTVTATNFILSSDERLKENIEKVCDNRVEVDWKTFELKADKGQKRYGVIAQELEKTNPEFVREGADGFKSVAYIDLLIAKIAELEARLEKLEK